MAQSSVKFLKELHRNTEVLSIYAPNQEPFNSVVRSLNARYSSTKKMWWLPWSKEMTNTAFKAFKDKATVDYSALKVGEENNRKPETGIVKSEIVKAKAKKARKRIR